MATIGGSVVPQTEVLKTLADLVRIPSVNPNYAGGTGERAIAEYVQRFFQDRGIETECPEVLPDRPNVLIRVPGKSSRRIVLEAHLDTVSAAAMDIDPFDPQIRDGKLYGRGACDTKAGLAAMMHAVADVVKDGQVPPNHILLAATIDEEYSFRGVADLCSTDGFHADAAIVAEPTELRSVIASKGLVRWKIETIGRSAHSAKPHLGINAIQHMSKIIAAIEVDTKRLASRIHPLLGPPTCSIGVIRGGVQINFVPDRCEIEIDRRLLPGESVSDVLANYQAIVDSVSANEPQMNVVMHSPMLTDVPLQTDPSASAVQTMRRVLSDLGLDDEPCGVPYCSDASKFGALGIPSMILGPGSIDQAHAAVEFVDCGQVEQAVDVYRRFLLTF
jgi:acetylornithine deacetylase